MTDNALATVVKGAVPDVLTSIAPELVKSIGDITKVVTTVNCKNQILLATAIKEIGPEFVKSADEIAKKLVECANVALLSDCKQAEAIVAAVMSDELTTMEQKVDLVIKYKQSRDDGLIKKVKAGAGTLTTIMIANAIPTVVKSVTSVVKAAIVSDTVKNFSLTSIIKAFKK